MNHLNNPGQGQQLALPAPAAPPMPAPAQPVPVPIIVHHSNQYKPAIMSTDLTRWNNTELKPEKQELHEYEEPQFYKLIQTTFTLI